MLSLIHKQSSYLKLIATLCELFLCGLGLLLFYIVGTMASCNYIQQIMLNIIIIILINNILIKQVLKIGSIHLNECNGKLISGLETLKACGKILISHPKG